MAKEPKSIGSIITKTLLNEAKNMARSEARSMVKGTVLKTFRNLFKKSEEDMVAELSEKLGFQTENYRIKNKVAEWKVSPTAIFELMENHKFFKDKMVLDEETNHLFYDGNEVDSRVKIDLVNKISQITGSSTHGIHRSFDKVKDYFFHTDLVASQFKKHFAGWDPSANSVIDRFIPELFGEGLRTELAYINPLFKKWIVGTAKRAMTPGELLDGCFVLQGEPGLGKTQFFRQLLPKPFEHRTGEIKCDVRQPVLLIDAVAKKTVACFDELSLLKATKGTEETFKTIISSQNIDVRLPYQTKESRYALRQGFGATTNENEFIRDRAISRRMWVLSLNGKTRLNFDRLHEMREGLWKEAVYLANKGELKTYLTPEEQKQVESENEKYIRKGF